MSNYDLNHELIIRLRISLIHSTAIYGRLVVCREIVLSFKDFKVNSPTYNGFRSRLLIFTLKLFYLVPSIIDCLHFLIIIRRKPINNLLIPAPMIVSSRTIIMLFAFLVIISACKSSNTAVVASSHESDFNDLENMEEASLMLADDMMPISRTIRQDLESYFQAFSELSLKEKEKRQQHIEYGMKYFQDNDTPVLIVVNILGDKKVYDEPTTIVNYLDYLKYTRKNPHTIGTFELNDDGKISKLELIVKTL